MKDKVLAFTLSASFAQAGLVVDFSQSAANVAPGAAGFIISSSVISPQTEVFLAGSPGYTGPAFDTGAGISAAMRVYAVGPGSFVNLLQLRNRDAEAADFASDWAFQGGTFDGDIARVGLRLTITGLQAGFYNFTSLHIDTLDMGGVMDAQYSLNSGVTWIDTIYDNASFTDGLTVELNNLAITETHGLQVRYLVGGNLFGTPGVARSGTTNFLLPHNNFTITPVPEPSLLWYVLSGIPALFMRRRAVRRSR